MAAAQEVFFSRVSQNENAILENADVLWANALRDADLDGNLRIKNLDADPLFQTPLVNQVQANFAAGLASADFIILASTLRHPGAWELLVRIYDAGKGEFVQSVFAKYPESESSALFTDAAQKTVRYLRQFINPLASIPRTPDGPGGFSWDVALGSGLFLGEWMDIARPLVSFRTGGSFWSAHTLWWQGDWRLNYRIQAGLEYQLWISEPEWEPFYTHTIRVFFPAYLHLEYNRLHSFLLGIAPALHWNIVAHYPAYNQPVLGLFPAFSLELIPGYAFWFWEDTMAIELTAPLEFVLREPLMMKLQGMIGLIWRIK